MIKLKRVQKLLKKTSRVPLASLNYHLGNYKEIIWLVSDGRSGSTWLSDLINADRSYRELFEPFHPDLVKKVKDYSLFQYLRPDDTNSHLGTFLKSVFSGEFKHFRSDVSQPRLFYKGLLVKDIFAHLLMPWVNHNIPHVKKILLIRNPFAVALSKQKLKGWTWMTDPQQFLEQKHLYDDYLAPFEAIFRTVGDDFIERQVLIWAIVHYIPLVNLANGDLDIIFYEDIVSKPKDEIAKLFGFLKKDHKENEDLLDRIYKPTRTSQKSHQSQQREDLINAWKDEVSTRQIDNGLKILEHFQLADVYGDTSRPNLAALVKGKFAAPKL